MLWRYRLAHNRTIDDQISRKILHVKDQLEENLDKEYLEKYHIYLDTVINYENCKLKINNHLDLIIKKIKDRKLLKTRLLKELIGYCNAFKLSINCKNNIDLTDLYHIFNEILKGYNHNFQTDASKLAELIQNEKLEKRFEKIKLKINE